MRLERTRLRGGAQVVDAIALRRKHRKHAIGGAGGEDERVIADALARIRHHPARAAVDGLDRRPEPEGNATAGYALRARDRGIMRAHLAGEHGLRQRRLFVRLVGLVGEQHHVGGGVLLLGGERRRDARRPAPDYDDLAGRIHAPVFPSAGLFWSCRSAAAATRGLVEVEAILTIRAGAGQARSAASISSIYSSPLAMTSIDA
jgi:hypothetical protein